MPKVKMDWFFNEPILKNALDYIIICESPIDCITLCQNGFNAMACMGANNINKGKIVKVRNIPIVYLCFDNDINESGQKAARRVGEAMVKMGANTYNIHIPFLLGPDINAMFVKKPTEFIHRLKGLIGSASRVIVEKTSPVGMKQTEESFNFNLLSLVEEYVELESIKDDKYRGICPLHEETQPSFYVDASKNRWICFGCGKGGDAIDFIRAINLVRGSKLGFKEAVDFLKSRDHNSRRSI